MLVTHLLKLNFIGFFFCVCFFSCQKKDNSPPDVTINSPLNYSSYQLPTSITITGEISDNRALNELEISIIDDDLIPITSTIYLDVTGKSYSFNETIQVNNSLISSGVFYIRVKAIDVEENFSTSYVTINLSEIPRELSGIYTVTSSLVNTQLNKLDSSGIFELKKEITGKHQVSIANSMYQYLFVGTDNLGEAIETSFFTQLWEIPIIPSTYSFFQDVFLNDDGTQLNISNGDGLIRHYNKNGLQVGGIVAPFQEWFAHFIRTEDELFGDYYMVDTYANIFTRWLVLFSGNSGLEYNRTAIDGEIIKIGKVNGSLYYVLTQQANKFSLINYDITSHQLWVEIEVMNTFCYDAFKKNDYLYITTNNGLYRFNYSNYQMLHLIDNFPCYNIAYEDISGDLLISDAQQLHFFNEQLGMYKSYASSDSIENILIYYNK